MRTISEIRNELVLKEIRTAYWEHNHSVPSMTELRQIEDEFEYEEAIV